MSLLVIKVNRHRALCLNNMTVGTYDPDSDGQGALYMLEQVAESLSSNLNLPIKRVSREAFDGWDWESILMQESQLLEAGDSLPGIDGCFYQWLRPTKTESGQRFLRIDGEEIDLSSLMFKTAEEAVAAIEQNLWGWSKEDAEDFVLVNVHKTIVANPLSNL